MMPTMGLAIAGGALTSLTLMLALLRLKSVRRVAARGAVAWMTTSRTSAVAVLGAAVAALSLCLAGAAPEKQAAVAVADLAPSAFDTHESEASAFPGGSAAPAVASDKRDRALGALRAFAEKIEGKRDTIAALNLSGTASPPESAGALPDVSTMMQRLRKRLEAEPGDVKGWRTLAWAYANTGQYGEAKTAYEAALKLAPQDEEIKAGLEAIREKAGGDAAPASGLEGSGAAAPATTTSPPAATAIPAMPPVR